MNDLISTFGMRDEWLLINLKNLFLTIVRKFDGLFQILNLISFDLNLNI